MGADRITTGPLSQAGTDAYDSPGSIVVDQQNGILHVVNASKGLSTAGACLAVIEQQLALAAITTAQTLFSKALNAGVLNVAGRWVHVNGWVIYSTTSTNVATLSFAVTLGGVTLATITTAATNTTASTNLPVQFQFDLFVPAGNKGGGTAAVVAHGSVSANIGTAAAGAIVTYLDTNVANDTITIGVNPAANDTITVNGTLVTFIPNGNTPAGNQVALGVSTTATATALYTFLAASLDPNIALSTWTNPGAGTVLGVSKASGFVTFASTSVPAKITFTTPTLDLTVAQTLAVTIAASAAVPSAQLVNATIEVEA
jgi:hypothetical protein